jgi:hypothetical protein
MRDLFRAAGGTRTELACSEGEPLGTTVESETQWKKHPARGSKEGGRSPASHWFPQLLTALRVPLTTGGDWCITPEGVPEASPLAGCSAAGRNGRRETPKHDRVSRFPRLSRPLPTTANILRHLHIASSSANLRGRDLGVTSLDGKRGKLPAAPASRRRRTSRQPVIGPPEADFPTFH